MGLEGSEDKILAKFLNNKYSCTIDIKYCRATNSFHYAIIH